MSGERTLGIAGLISREWGRFVGYVRSRIDDASDRDAEDIVQDVMEGLFQRGDPTEPIADLSAYVYRALRNRVVDAYRRRRLATTTLDEAHPDSRYDVGKVLEGEADRDRLHHAISGLPAPQRAVLVATELEGRTFRELSEEWGIPLGTLLARKHRAVAALRRTLGGSV